LELDPAGTLREVFETLLPVTMRRPRRRFVPVASGDVPAVQQAEAVRGDIIERSRRVLEHLAVNIDNRADCTTPGEGA
jgi:hypothetical protein